MVGDKTPDGGALYARTRPRRAVFTIPSYVEGSFDKKPFDLRDRNVLHVKRDEVMTLDVAGPEGAYALARRTTRASGRSRSRCAPAPAAGRWTACSARSRACAWSRWRRSGHGPEAVRPRAAARTVTLGLAGGGTRTLEIGSSRRGGAPPRARGRQPAGGGGPRRAGGRPGQGDGGAARQAPAGGVDLRGRGLRRGDAGGRQKTYARSTGKDKDGVDTTSGSAPRRTRQDLDTNKVEDALFQMGGVEARSSSTRPKAPAAYGLDAPALKVTLRMAGRQAAAVVRDRDRRTGRPTPAGPATPRS